MGMLENLESCVCFEREECSLVKMEFHKGFLPFFYLVIYVFSDAVFKYLKLGQVRLED